MYSTNVSTRWLDSVCQFSPCVGIFYFSTVMPFHPSLCNLLLYSQPPPAPPSAPQHPSLSGSSPRCTHNAPSSVGSSQPPSFLLAEFNITIAFVLGRILCDCRCCSHLPCHFYLGGAPPAGQARRGPPGESKHLTGNTNAPFEDHYFIQP